MISKNDDTIETHISDRNHLILIHIDDIVEKNEKFIYFKEHILNDFNTIM